MKVKCSRCDLDFTDDQDIYIDKNGKPVHFDELEEDFDKWTEEYKEIIFDDLKTKFERDVRQWKEWFYKTHSCCDGIHDESEYWVPNDELTEIKGSKYCEDCIINMEENK